MRGGARRNPGVRNWTRSRASYCSSTTKRYHKHVNVAVAKARSKRRRSKEWRKERREHPTMSKASIDRIVYDHAQKRRGKG